MSILNRKFRINGLPTVLTVAPLNDEHLEVRCAVDFHGTVVQAKQLLNRQWLALAREPESVIEETCDLVTNATIAAIKELSK